MVIHLVFSYKISSQVGSIRWLLAQPDPRASFMKLKAGAIPEVANSKYSILSILNEEMPGVYNIRCMRCTLDRAKRFLTPTFRFLTPVFQAGILL